MDKKLVANWMHLVSRSNNIEIMHFSHSKMATGTVQWYYPLLNDYLVRQAYHDSPIYNYIILIMAKGRRNNKKIKIIGTLTKDIEEEFGILTKKRADTLWLSNLELVHVVCKESVSVGEIKTVTFSTHM